MCRVVMATTSRRAPDRCQLCQVLSYANGTRVCPPQPSACELLSPVIGHLLPLPKHLPPRKSPPWTSAHMASGGFRLIGLLFLGHTMRKQGSCQEKAIMQGTMPGARRRGRPHTAWMDNIKTWTGLLWKSQSE